LLEGSTNSELEYLAFIGRLSQRAEMSLQDLFEAEEGHATKKELARLNKAADRDRSALLGAMFHDEPESAIA